jgi:glycosyltransferase involved in cell wall biosynthesis
MTPRTIWLVNPYGPLPNEGWRETRYAMMADHLARCGHDVTWWTSDYSHHSKRFRSAIPNSQIDLPYTIRLVRTPPYRRHIGIRRLLFEVTFAVRIYLEAMRARPPELIISGDTTMATSVASTALARRHGAKLVFDIIDLYPEIFATIFPKRCRSVSRVLLWPLFCVRRRHFLRADAIMAVCREYLAIGPIIPTECSAIPLIPVYWGVDVDELRRVRPVAEGCLDSGAGVPHTEGEVRVVYAGTLGAKYDIESLMEAALALQKDQPSIKFVIAGDGPRRTQLESYILQHGLSNVLVLGPVAPQRLAALYRQCDIGLCLYSSGSTVAMPIKAFDYFAAGLPVISSVTGELQEVLSREHTGLTYVAGVSGSLTQALIQLSADAQLRSAMAQNSHRLAMTFDKRNQYCLVSELVERLMSAGRTLA